ncbi:MAG: restriction endonuclease subunit S [Hyphomicrobiaceae bacterium]|nr:restriction endonuclease subunit S [Hyphomicrobiaceae bacterium]
MVALNQVSEINPKGPKAGTLPPDEEFDFVPMASVSEQGIVSVQERRCYEHVAKGFTAFKNNDVLLAKITPCYENNKIALANVSTQHAFGSTEFHVVRCDQDEIDPKYLTYYLRQDRVRYAGEQRMTGSAGQRRVPKVFLEELKIPLPPLAEQKRIALILDQADALRRLRKRALDKLGSLGQSIFYDMFGDPRTNPHQYKIFQFGDLGEIKLGKMLDRGKVRGDKSLPYLRNANVRWFSFDLHDVSEMDFFESEFDRFRVMPDDLLICEGGEPGRCAIWNDAETEIYYQKALHRARFDTTLALPEYVAHWIYLAATLGMLIDSVSSATIAHLTGQKLKKLSLMIPPIEKQRSFVRVISELNELSENTSSALASDESLFAALQQRAFRGEL